MACRALNFFLFGKLIACHSLRSAPLEEIKTCQEDTPYEMQNYDFVIWSFKQGILIFSGIRRDYGQSSANICR